MHTINSPIKSIPDKRNAPAALPRPIPSFSPLSSGDTGTGADVDDWPGHNGGFGLGGNGHGQGESSLGPTITLNN